ncbi:conserved Plasmodium protein, unknown function [Plasmodium malariae]|uniref:Transmembrane protein n=1 Tax=Plasmodium malariae TaxID=5858 RepID=A0A1C3KB72_PLAMA|nr:conserved Plasmodium protein, unknown function [Plasmodium malariae]
MCRLKYFFFFFFFTHLFALLLTMAHASHEYNNPRPQENAFAFVQTKISELKIADPPYTVFNFATEAANTNDIIEDELKRKEKKAMRRFKHDLHEKKERVDEILEKILKSSMQFFEH